MDPDRLQRKSDFIGPFDQNHAFSDVILEPQVPDLRFAAKAV